MNRRGFLSLLGATPIAAPLAARAALAAPHQTLGGVSLIRFARPLQAAPIGDGLREHVLALAPAERDLCAVLHAIEAERAFACSHDLFCPRDVPDAPLPKPLGLIDDVGGGP